MLYDIITKGILTALKTMMILIHKICLGLSGLGNIVHEL